jgi:hypothetical protein
MPYDSSQLVWLKTSLGILRPRRQFVGISWSQHRPDQQYLRHFEPVDADLCGQQFTRVLGEHEAGSWALEG